jgi:hypothetical protein
MDNKTIVNPNKLVRDMVAGKTIDESLNSVATTPTIEGVQPMVAMSNRILEQFVGDCVLVYTVSFAFTGRLVLVQDGFIMIEDSSWIADVGRPSETLKTLKFLEVEYLGINMPINIQSIVYIAPIPGLPNTTV